jgi:hypothetical protein
MIKEVMPSDAFKIKADLLYEFVVLNLSTQLKSYA